MIPLEGLHRSREIEHVVKTKLLWVLGRDMYCRRMMGYDVRVVWWRF
jgi:hypothetical protein